MMRCFWCLLGLLAGCFAPSYPEGIPCSERDTCPPGMLCDPSDHVCRRELSPGCTRGEDCESGICDTAMGTCAPARCDDDVRNGSETDVDCGGSACPACGNGGTCERPADCQSGTCNQRTCAPPGCGDGVVQGDEDCDDTGASAACDADCTLPVCGDGVINAAAGEACDTADGMCCSTTCTDLVAAGTVCRVAAAACDDVEVCDGVNAPCPPDALQPQGSLCRAVAGDCDVAEQCDGMNTDCPPDALQPQGTVCRAGARDCDAAEQCDGAVASCPADAAAVDGSACDDCSAGPGLCDVCTAGECPNLCGNGVIDREVGEECDGSQDASCPGHCDQSCACAFPPTCLAYKTAVPALPDGRYTIDPDGAGGLEPFEVPCDMTTDGGGWTVIEYASDLPLAMHFNSGSNVRQYLPQNFALALGGAQIAAIQAQATEGFQRYVGLCSGVLHYFYPPNTYLYAFGFRFRDGTETPNSIASYAPFDVAVPQDGCSTNGGEGGDPGRATIFEIRSPLVPVVNVSCGDNGDAGELFGSPLTQNPARLR